MIMTTSSLSSGFDNRDDDMVSSSIMMKKHKIDLRFVFIVSLGLFSFIYHCNENSFSNKPINDVIDPTNNNNNNLIQSFFPSTATINVVRRNNKNNNQLWQFVKVEEEKKPTFDVTSRIYQQCVKWIKGGDHHKLQQPHNVNILQKQEVDLENAKKQRILTSSRNVEENVVIEDGISIDIDNEKTVEMSTMKRIIIKYNTLKGKLLIQSIANKIYYDYDNDGYFVIELDINLMFILHDAILTNDIDSNIEDDTIWTEQGILEQIIYPHEMNEYIYNHSNQFKIKKRTHQQQKQDDNNNNKSNHKNNTRSRRELYDDEVLPYGIAMIQADQVTVGPYGSNTLVCIVDTGVARLHPDLNIFEVTGTDRVTSSSSSDSSTYNNDQQLLQWDRDMRGHGTHISGTIAAKVNNRYGLRGVGDISIYMTRGLDDVGFARESDIRQAIEQCEDQHIIDSNTGEIITKVIISLSLAGPAMSSLMSSLIDRLYRKGIIMVAAAGNEATSIPYYPASYGKVISVAAVDSNEMIWENSNYSPYTELAAPGVSIISTGIDFSTTEYNTDVLQDDDSSNTNYNSNIKYTYTVYSGTSMATPHVAGAIAILSSYYPHCNPNQIRYALAKTAKDKGQIGCDNYYGYGIIQIKDALDFLSVTPCDRTNPRWGRRYVGAGSCTVLQ